MSDGVATFETGAASTAGEDGAAAIRPWWVLGAPPLLALGAWTLLADVPGWNTVWYLFAWYGWLLLLDGVVFAYRGRSWMASHGRRLPAMLLASVPFWYLYEAYNLRLANWYYVFTLRSDGLQLLVSVLAFATVLPACLLHAEAVFALRWVRDARWRPLAIRPGLEAAFIGLGVASMVLPLLWPRWAFPLVWGVTFWLPEVHNWRRGADSLLGDLAAGRPQRLLSLLLGGLVAGIVWELLNYWARCKWIYTVPFFDRLKLFEMPVLGFFGFPFLALGAFAYWSLGGRRPRWQRWRVVAAAVVAAIACGLVLQQVLAHTVRSRRPLLDELAGLGPDGAAALARAGIPTPERLERAVARRGPAEVAGASGLSPASLAAASGHAALALHKGMGSASAALLLAAGVRDVASLGDEQPATLAARLRALARRRGLEAPRLAEVKVWVEAARGRSRPSR